MRTWKCRPPAGRPLCAALPAEGAGGLPDEEASVSRFGGALLLARSSSTWSSERALGQVLRHDASLWMVLWHPRPQVSSKCGRPGTLGTSLPCTEPRSLGSQPCRGTSSWMLRPPPQPRWPLAGSSEPVFLKNPLHFFLAHPLLLLCPVQINSLCETFLVQMARWFPSPGWTRSKTSLQSIAGDYYHKC